jgi:hypothetical protein
LPDRVEMREVFHTPNSQVGGVLSTASFIGPKNRFDGGVSFSKRASDES